MSELINKVVSIDSIKPHPNADRLEIAIVGGWQVIVGKGNHKACDILVHIQPDSMVTKEWAEKWGVTKYLSWKINSDRGRVKFTNLRGVASFGFLVENETGANVGTDLTEHYNITKYEPPPPPSGMQSGLLQQEHYLFHRYTDIQNLRNYPDELAYEVPLVCTEKIHGTNSRVGWVRNKDNTIEKVVGSHKTQRKLDNCGIYGLPLELYGEQLDKLYDIIAGTIVGSINSIIVFGEIFGPGIQDLHYGNKKDYRVFDIAINGKYLTWNVLNTYCAMVKLPVVPIIDCENPTFENLLKLAEGKTIVNGENIREGIVVRPLDINLQWLKNGHPARMIFKVISKQYMTRKGGTEYH